ncbi:MAG: hypothetical protein ACO2PL_07115 [Armatimonadota bacterium]
MRLSSQNFRQCKSTATQNYSPLATRCSPFATRHSLLAAVLTFASRYSLPFPDLPICRFHDLPIRFGSAGTSPSHDFRF